MIIGHGIDLVDLDQFERLLSVPAGDLLERCFLTEEQSAVGEGSNRVERLAGRFAAKEAVMKALGAGFGAGIGFLHVEIRIESNCAPAVVLHGPAEELARKLGATRCLVSISHDERLAIASAIAVRD